MGTLHYINMNGAKGTGTGLSKGNERNTLPAQVAGDVWSFERGSTWVRSAQHAHSNPLCYTNHGNPDAPKPQLIVNTTAATSGVNCTQDAIFHGFDIRDFQPATNLGHAINFAPRGGGALNSGPGAGGIFLDCDFNNIKGTAVLANPNDSTVPTASSDFMVFLKCKFDNIGDDAMFLKSRYLRVGWSDFTRISMISTSGDCVHNMDAFLEYAWIHDNLFNHQDRDYKHSIMLDDPTAGMASGLAVIENNVSLGYGTNVDDGIPAALNVGFNIEMRAIIRGNYLRTKGIAMRVGNHLAPLLPRTRSEVYSNIIDQMAGFDEAAVTFHHDADFMNNTLVRRGLQTANFGVQFNTMVREAKAQANFFSNYGQAIRVNAGAGYIKPNFNGFHKCGTKSNVLTTNDVDFLELPFAGPVRNDFRPVDAAMFFQSFDRRYPDFWGNFAPAGIGHIGACLGAF